MGCADLLKKCLAAASKDNMTVMVVQFTDGSDYAASEDEIKNYGEMMRSQSDDEMRKQYLTFLASCDFPAEPVACANCGQWRLRMHQCSCRAAVYCGRSC